MKHCLFFVQAQEDLKLSQSMKKSADLRILQDELKKAEMKIEQMSIEKDTLFERLKVGEGQEIKYI